MSLKCNGIVSEHAIADLALLVDNADLLGQDLEIQLSIAKKLLNPVFKSVTSINS